MFFKSELTVFKGLGVILEVRYNLCRGNVVFAFRVDVTLVSGTQHVCLVVTEHAAAVRCEV